MVAKTPYPIAGDDFGWGDDERYEAERIAHWALVEDLGSAGDITTAATIPDGRRAAAAIKARRAGIVAGLPCLPVILDLHRGGVEFEPAMTDGPIKAGGTAGRLRGPLKGILEVERTCLNFLCRLSGTATMTGEFVELAAGTRAKICDTRKTTPGWRRLEKYAVRVGGGVNHRIGLFDAVLIKDNHLAGLATTSARPVAEAIERARKAAPAGTIVEVEVDGLEQLREALAAGPDIVLLDNMTTGMLTDAVALRDTLAPEVLLEASGGVRRDTVKAIAATGVDRISAGALTHSAPALDLGLDFEGK